MESETGKGECSLCSPEFPPLVEYLLGHPQGEKSWNPSTKWWVTSPYVREEPEGCSEKPNPLQVLFYKHFCMLHDAPLMTLPFILSFKKNHRAYHVLQSAVKKTPQQSTVLSETGVIHSFT